MESVDKATYPRQKWPAVAFPLFLIATAVTAMQYKIPTIVVPVMQQFQIDAYVASWLMSIFTFVGIVFSLPIGALARAFPPKRIILAAAGLACLSSMAGAFSQSVKMLLVTRAFEGVSLVCVIACGPIVIQQCVDPARTGTASGVWMLGGMIGATLAGATTPFLYNAVGFQGLWIAYAAFAALAGVVVALVVKVPASASAERSGGRRDADSLAKEDLRSEFNVFFKPNTWAFFSGVRCFSDTASFGAFVCSDGYAATGDGCVPVGFCEYFADAARNCFICGRRGAFRCSSSMQTAVCYGNVGYGLMRSNPSNRYGAPPVGRLCGDGPIGNGGAHSRNLCLSGDTGRSEAYDRRNGSAYARTEHRPVFRLPCSGKLAGSRDFQLVSLCRSALCAWGCGYRFYSAL